MPRFFRLENGGVKILFRCGCQGVRKGIVYQFQERIVYIAAEDEPAFPGMNIFLVETPDLLQCGGGVILFPDLIGVRMVCSE